MPCVHFLCLSSNVMKCAIKINKVVNLVSYQTFEDRLTLVSHVSKESFSLFGCLVQTHFVCFGVIKLNHCLKLKSQLHKSSFSVHGTFNYVLHIRFNFKHLKLKSGCGPSELCNSALFRQVKLLNRCQSDLKRLNLHVFSLC